MGRLINGKVKYFWPRFWRVQGVWPRLQDKKIFKFNALHVKTPPLIHADFAWAGGKVICVAGRRWM